MTFKIQGNGPRLTPTDGYTVIHWTCNESSPPLQNTGTGAALNLSSVHGTPVSAPGLFGSSIGLPLATVSSGSTSVNEVFTNALTVSAWVKMDGGTFGGSGYAPILIKEADSSNDFPYDAFSMWLYADGTVSGDVVTSDTRHGIGPTAAPYMVSVGSWSLIAQTYDGTTHRLYLNGDLVGSAACTGNIDYRSHGPWVVGGYDADISGYNMNASIDDIRVENTVRSQAYLREMYQSGIGLSTTVTYKDVPATVPGLALWLRADLGVTLISGLVSNWGDQSGNNRDASQTSSGSRPSPGVTIGGMPAFNFTGSGYSGEFLVTPSFPAQSSRTIFVVYSFQGTQAADGRMVESSYVTDYFLGTEAGGICLIIGGDSPRAIGGVITGASVICATFDSSGNMKIYQNGTLVASQTDATIASSVIARYINSSPSGPFGSVGYMAEAIEYDHNLNPTDLATVTTYLRNRYGL